jgi:sensor histidine kinase YesM
MQGEYTDHTHSFSRTRFIIHVAFWLMIWFFTAFVYGYEKQNLYMALKNNLFLLPVHIVYFYTVSYFIIPRYLLTRKYFKFFLVLVMFIFLMPWVTRLIDIYLVEPNLDAYLRNLGVTDWPKVQGTKFERFTNLVYYLNAFKGANLIVWFAVVIKFFEFWYKRHHAALQAELDLLKAQIHPHFLFNTLNNLYALTLNRSPKSPEIVLGLSEILRYMLYECNVESVTLKKDIEVLENFILLEKMRYEERLDLNFTKEGSLEVHKIAPLLLLPLVENAFKHGASEKVGQAWISIDLIVKEQVIKFKVSNSKAELSHEGNKPVHGNIGLQNVKKRLELIYPNAHSLKVFNEEDMFAVILEIDLTKRVSL